MTDQTPTGLTVLLPTHRLTSDLDQAVASVLQDLEERDELLIVLDGFKSAVEVEGRWPDARVRCVAHPDGGSLARALNFGIALAKYDLVARMDSDDISLRGRFAAQRSFMDEHRDVGLVGGQIEYIDGSGARTGGLSLPEGTDVGNHLLKRNVFAHPTIVFRRELLVAVGGYDEALSFSEDYEMYLRLAHVSKLANLADVVLAYRLHPGQMSRADRAFSRHSFVILRARRRLAESSGDSALVQRCRNAVWFGAQVLRRWGLRRPTARFTRGGRA